MPINPLPYDQEASEHHDNAPPIPNRLLGALQWLMQSYLEGCAAYALAMYPPPFSPREITTPPLGRRGEPVRKRLERDGPARRPAEPHPLASRRPSSDHRPPAVLLWRRWRWWRSQRSGRPSRPATNMDVPTDDSFCEIDRLDRMYRVTDRGMP